MRAGSVVGIVLILIAASTGTNVYAQDKAAYQQQSIARFLETFASLDYDRNGEVSREEAQGNVEFTATFDDIDINRDGVITRAELDRFLALQFAYTIK